MLLSVKYRPNEPNLPGPPPSHWSPSITLFALHHTGPLTSSSSLGSHSTLTSSCDYTQIESDSVKRGAQTFKVFHQNRHALMSLPVAAVWSDVVGGFGVGVVAT